MWRLSPRHTRVITRRADLFASEYSALLARRLLEKTTFDIEDELKKVPVGVWGVVLCGFCSNTTTFVICIIVNACCRSSC